MKKCQIIVATKDEIGLIKKEIEKDKEIFIGEINGSKINTLEEYYLAVGEEFQFPTVVQNLNAYYDWMTDLGWLNKGGYVAIIHNYRNFLLKEEKQWRDRVFRIFLNILFFWHEEVERVVVGGKSKPFTVYLVD